jgi:PhzF family phenazine biosynthesis protein
MNPRPSPQTRPFKQIDVFGATPYMGNPLAVVLDGTGLSDAAMQDFARWTQLSETSYLLPPTETGRAAGADYRVRIFTPAMELPFAGHPTLGSCHAWLDAGGQPRAADHILQECGVGLVRICRNGQRLTFAAPHLQRSQADPALLAKVLSALGLQPQQVLAAQLLNNGPVWLGLLLGSTDSVLALDPDHAALKSLGYKVGVAARYAQPGGAQLIGRSSREARAFNARSTPPAATPDLEVRAFAAPAGINEDPVTGSLNASLAQWLIADGHLPSRYLAAQGCALGCAGRVQIEQDASGQVWVGGESATCMDGQVRL